MQAIQRSAALFLTWISTIVFLHPQSIVATHQIISMHWWYYILQVTMTWAKLSLDTPHSNGCFGSDCPGGLPNSGG